MNEKPASRFLDKSTQPSMLTLMLLASISALAMNSFLPTLDIMAGFFNSSTAIMGLSVGIYLGSSAIFQILAGPLSDNIGRRTVSIGALIIFIFASLGCIYSPNLESFMLFRAVQAASACLMVIARAVVRDTTSTEKSGAKIANISLGMAISPMLGPAIGGFLGGLFGWEANFWLIVLLGLLTLIVVYLDQGETRPQISGGFWQQFRSYPELLSSTQFWGYCFASAFAAGTFFSFLGGGTFVGAVVYNLSPEILGLYFAIPALGFLIGTLFAGKYSTIVGIDKMILIGISIIVLGLSMSLLFSFLGFSTADKFFGSMVLVGLGNGICMPNATAGMLAVKPSLAGAASGLGGSMMIAFGALLSTTAGLILTDESTEVQLLIMMWVLSLCALTIALFTKIKRKLIVKNVQ